LFHFLEMQLSSPMLDWLVNNSLPPHCQWGCLSEVFLLANGLDVWFHTGYRLRVGVVYALVGGDKGEEMDAQ